MGQAITTMEQQTLDQNNSYAGTATNTDIL